MKVSSPLAIHDEIMKEKISHVREILDNETIKVLVGVDKVQKGTSVVDRGRYTDKTFVEALNSLFPHLKYRSFREEVFSLESLENCWGAYLALYESLEKRFLTEKRLDEGKSDLELSEREKEFIQFYSLYCGSLIGMDILKEETGTESVSTEELKPFKIQGKDAFLRNSISDYIDFIKSKQGKYATDSREKLIQNTATFFKNYANAILSCRGDYEDIINYFNVNGIELKIGDTKIQGFSLSRFEESKFHVEVPFDKIVGNSEMKRIVFEAIYNVMSMGPGETTNPLMPFMQYFIIIGSSGCGKTVTIMAMFNEAMKIAKEHDLPAEVVIIMGSKFKSEYQNKSANEFRRIFTDRVWKPDKRRFVYMPDFDTMMPSRKAKDARQEDNQLVGEALNIIDGAETPRTGHFVLFADVNLVGDDETSSIDILDPAIYTRFFKISAKGAETKEDYKNLFLNVCLQDALKEGYILTENIKENNPFWTSYGSEDLNKYMSEKLKHYGGEIKSEDLMNEIAGLCVESKVAGRDVANLSKEVANYGKWFDKTKIPGYFRMSNEEKLKIMPQHYRKVHMVYIMKELLSLLKLQEGEKQKDWHERKKRLKDSYLLEKEVVSELEKSWEKEYESKEGSVLVYGDKKE